MNNIILENEKLTEVNENIKLIQKLNGLTFGTDAFLLASFIKAQRSGIAVELGGGTGIISLLCASREKFKSIYCAEIQKDFADIITRNASLNNLDNKVISICDDVDYTSPKGIKAMGLFMLNRENAENYLKTLS